MESSNTTNKRRAWIYLLSYYNDWGFMPTLQEIANNAFGRRMTREGARYVLRQLERDGKIKVEPGKNRGIRLASEI